jgi:Pvc16 N-terminal domain
MAGFGAIAAVGKSIETVLNAGYAVAQPTSSGPTVARLVQTDDLAQPDQKIQRPGLSLLLYRVDFSKTMRATWADVGARDGRSHLPLDLHYLLTAWALNAEDEHRVVGRTMQILERLGGLSGAQLLPDGDWSVGESVQLHLEDMPTDNLMRTFDSLRCDFRLSVPYIARVVVVSTDDGAAGPDVVTAVRGVRVGSAP